MNLKEFQVRASLTDQNPNKQKVHVDKNLSDQDIEYSQKQKSEIIPLLGLVGEVGSLLSEYKKMIRDGNSHTEFKKMVSEELGDILWYVSTVATNFGLNLEEIANENLMKTQDRWHEPEKNKLLYDSTSPQEQQFPRKFTIQFSHEMRKGVNKLVLTDLNTGKNIGDPLTDNTYEDDGYRFHDVLHLAFIAHFGWSPIFRSLFRNAGLIKEKRNGLVDEAEDGGRAKVIEEGIIAASYVYAVEHNFLEGVNTIDWQLIRHLQGMTKKLEIKDRKAWEWNNLLLNGFKIWREVRKNNGGIVEGDLLTGKLTYSKSPKTL